MTVPLKLTRYLNKETEYFPWHSALGSLSYIGSMISLTESYGLYKVIAIDDLVAQLEIKNTRIVRSDFQETMTNLAGRLCSPYQIILTSFFFKTAEIFGEEIKTT